MKRQRHNFKELTFDEHGDIIIEEDEDKDDDYSVTELMPSTRKRKTKIDDEDIQPIKRQNQLLSNAKSVGQHSQENST